MGNKEQSAIDAIYEILDQIRLLNDRMTIIDNNIKLINNRLNKMNKAGPTATSGPTATTGAVVQAEIPPANNNVLHLIKIFGRVKNQNKKPIKDVYVKIYSPKGDVMKSRTTDSDGYWEARMPAGSYGIELDASHINKKFRPINRNITINDTMNEFEVK